MVRDNSQGTHANTTRDGGDPARWRYSITKMNAPKRDIQIRFYRALTIALSLLIVALLLGHQRLRMQRNKLMAISTESLAMAKKWEATAAEWKSVSEQWEKASNRFEREVTNCQAMLQSVLK